MLFITAGTRVQRPQIVQATNHHPTILLPAAGGHPIPTARGLQFTLNATAPLPPLPNTGFQQPLTTADPRPMLTVADPWFMPTPHSTRTSGMNACIAKTMYIETVCFSHIANI